MVVLVCVAFMRVCCTASPWPAPGTDVDLQPRVPYSRIERVSGNVWKIRTRAVGIFSGHLGQRAGDGFVESGIRGRDCDQGAHSLDERACRFGHCSTEIELTETTATTVPAHRTVNRPCSAIGFRCARGQIERFGIGRSSRNVGCIWPTCIWSTIP